MSVKHHILNAALETLRQGEALTIDSVARQSQLTKPGVIHHFATKENLALAVVNHLLDRWETELEARVDEDASPSERLRAYVDFALMADLDSSDLAFLSDVRLRDKMTTQWTTRLRPWVGVNIVNSVEGQARVDSVRLLADGAWFDRALGVIERSEDERKAILSIALEMIDEGEHR